MRFSEMTWPMVQAIPRDSVLVVAPIAACEQHSRHLPTFTDTILVTTVAERLEQSLPEEVLLLPTLWLGASHHHLPFGATLSAPVESHVRLIQDLLIPVLEDGFQRILVLNGHGGNIDTMQTALRALQPRYFDRFLSGASYWSLASNELAELADGPRKVMGHACEFETSMMMALRPELVQTEEIHDDIREENPQLRGLFVAEDFGHCTERGAMGYPTQASAEKGERMLEVIVNRCREVVTGILHHSSL